MKHWSLSRPTPFKSLIPSPKEDIEISGFLAATIAWEPKSIITNAKKMMELMENSPHDFILHHQEKDLKHFDGFVHRTFNSEDLSYFVRALKHIYSYHNGLEAVFAKASEKTSWQMAIHHFKQLFFSSPTLVVPKNTFRSVKRFCSKNAETCICDGWCVPTIKE